jgi:hypothetical protein
MGGAAMVSVDRIVIESLASGSVIASLRILPAGDVAGGGGSLSATEVFSKLQEQVSDPRSALYEGQLTRAVNGARSVAKLEEHKGAKIAGNPIATQVATPADPTTTDANDLRVAELEQELQQRAEARETDAMRAAARCLVSSAVAFGVATVSVSTAAEAVQRNALAELVHQEAVCQVARECVVLATTAARHKAEMLHARQSHGRALAQLLAERVQEHEDDVQQLEKAAQQEQIELQKQLVTLSGDVDDAVRTQAAEHAAAVTKLKVSHDSAIEEVQQVHAMAMSDRLGTERELRAQLLILREAGGKFGDGHQQAVAELQASVRMEIQERNAVLAARREAQHEKALRQEQEEHDAALVRMEGDLMASIGEMEAGHAKSMAACESDHAFAMTARAGRETELQAQLLVLPLMQKRMDAMEQERTASTKQVEGRVNELRSQLLALPLVPKLLTEVNELRARSSAVRLLLQQLNNRAHGIAVSTKQRCHDQHEMRGKFVKMQAELQERQAQLLVLPLMTQRIRRLEQTQTSGAAAAIPLLLSRLAALDAGPGPA